MAAVAAADVITDNILKGSILIMRSGSEIEQAIERHADMVKHICYVYMKNNSDTEDIFQDVFLKYALFSGSFQSEEHEKAWLIRVTVNRCKDILKSFFKSKVCSLDDIEEMAASQEEDHREVLGAVMQLPDQYRIVIYLFYYEGYSAAEIARMLKKKENTVYTCLGRGREKLKKLLGGEVDG